MTKSINLFTGEQYNSTFELSSVLKPSIYPDLNVSANYYIEIYPLIELSSDSNLVYTIALYSSQPISTNNILLEFNIRDPLSSTLYYKLPENFKHYNQMRLTQDRSKLAYVGTRDANKGLIYVYDLINQSQLEIEVGIQKPTLQAANDKIILYSAEYSPDKLFVANIEDQNWDILLTNLPPSVLLTNEAIITLTRVEIYGTCPPIDVFIPMNSPLIFVLFGILLFSILMSKILNKLRYTQN